MELSQKIAWTLLAALHIGPALPAVLPQTIKRLYDVDPSGTIGTLLIHRGVLFLAIAIAALYAIFDPGVRPLSALLLTLSMVGFLIHYLRAGMPDSALRKIAVLDLIGLIPLAWVSWQAWF